jgi:MoxR-like ATPase
MIVAKKKKIAEPGILSPQEKLQALVHNMDSALIGRTQEIRLTLTAILAKEHLLLVSKDPGVAKTLIAKTICKWIQGAGNPFVIQLGGDVPRDFIFGPMDFILYKQGTIARKLEGGAAKAHFMVLEEIFKANPIATNMFLLMLSDRIYKEGLVSCDVPLKSCLASSNEWHPEGCEGAVAALSDRFVLRANVIPVKGRSYRHKLTWGESGLIPKVPKSIQIDLTELDRIYEEVDQVLIPDEIKEITDNILQKLEDAGIEPGNRRIGKIPKILRAFTYLMGGSFTEIEHLSILSHMLWMDPKEQPDKVHKIITKMIDPYGNTIQEKVQEMEKVISSDDSDGNKIEKLKDIRIELSNLPKSNNRSHALTLASDEMGKILKRLA